MDPDVETEAMEADLLPENFGTNYEISDEEEEITATWEDRNVPPRILSIFEIFLLGSSEDMIDAFFTIFPLTFIMRLRPLSSSMFYAVQAYIDRAWDVDRFLGRWFYHIPSFLSVMESCGGVISGTEAQQFLARRQFRGRNLDIYVPWHGVLELGRWLKTRGFRFQPTVDKHPLFDAAVFMAAAFVGPKAVGLESMHPNSGRSSSFTTFSFIRPARELHYTFPMGTFIQLTAVHGDPVEFIVHKAPSTGLMNYLTATHAVSLFPRATFVRREMVVCQDLNQHARVAESWMRKWSGRGFTILTAADRIPVSLELRAWRRTIGDHHTWVLPYASKDRVTVKRTPPVVSNLAFEVLPHHYGVAASGAMLRVGPRFLYSSIAFLANPWVDLGKYCSLEVTSAFAEYFPENETDTEASDEEIPLADDWDDMV